MSVPAAHARMGEPVLTGLVNSYAHVQIHILAPCVKMVSTAYIDALHVNCQIANVYGDTTCQMSKSSSSCTCQK